MATAVFTEDFIMIPAYRARKFIHRLTRALVPQQTQQQGDILAIISLSEDGAAENVIYKGPMTRRAVRRLAQRLGELQKEQRATVEIMIFTSPGLKKEA